jgi:hypothetical protein
MPTPNSAHPVSYPFLAPAFVSQTEGSGQSDPPPSSPQPPKACDGASKSSAPRAAELRNVYIASLPPRFTTKELYDLASAYGVVVSLRMFTETKTTAHTRHAYGFVLYDSPASAERAVAALADMQLGDRRLQVRLSKNGVTKDRQQQPSVSDPPRTATTVEHVPPVASSAAKSPAVQHKSTRHATSLRHRRTSQCDAPGRTFDPDLTRAPGGTPPYVAYPDPHALPSQPPMPVQPYPTGIVHGSAPFQYIMGGAQPFTSAGIHGAYPPQPQYLPAFGPPHQHAMGALSHPAAAVIATFPAAPLQHHFLQARQPQQPPPQQQQNLQHLQQQQHLQHLQQQHQQRPSYSCTLPLHPPLLPTQLLHPHQHSYAQLTQPVVHTTMQFPQDNQHLHQLNRQQLHLHALGTTGPYAAPQARGLVAVPAALHYGPQ